MRKSILILLLTCFSFLYLASCGGGDGNGTVPPEVEEFTVFMNLGRIELTDGVDSPCPKPSVDLELRLTLAGDEVFGEARLMNTSMLGDAIEIIGIVVEESIVIDPFLVNVDWIPHHPSLPEESTMSFSFSSFLGNLSDNDQDKTTKEMEVIASGRVSEVGEGDTSICDGNFRVEALADECLPSSFFPHSDCLAESISEACNFVTGCATPFGPGGLHGDFYIGCGRQTDCVCEVLSCDSLICPFPVKNIRIDPQRVLGLGLVGIDPDNPDEFTFTCGTGFGP